MITLNVRGTRLVEKTLREIAPREALNLSRATVSALASDIVKEARKSMKFSGPFSVGRMRRATGKKRRQVRQGIVQEDVIVDRRAFYWRFYERGQGGSPRREMFGKAVVAMHAQLPMRFEEIFMKKLVARLARVRKTNKAKLAGGRGR